MEYVQYLLDFFVLPSQNQEQVLKNAKQNVTVSINNKYVYFIDFFVFYGRYLYIYIDMMNLF